MFACLVTLTTLAARARAAAPSFAVGPPPAWIALAAPLDGPEETAGGAANGVRHLLYDRQVRVGDGRQDSYLRLVQQITNESGLQTASQLDIAFDPSFQALTIHDVVVRRGSEVLDRLNRGAVRLIQREKNLDAQVYDGEVSAVLFLEDLRVGDVVDFAYSIRGSDPTLFGRYADTLQLGATVPVGHLHARVIVPRGRQVHFAARGPVLPAGFAGPSIGNVGNDEVEYVWDLLHVKAYVAETDAPASFEQLPWVQATEFASWQEVARLIGRLFDVAGSRSDPLNAWVLQARSQSTSLDEFLRRTTRFVQDEIRYVAVEVGMSRRRPAEPTTVFERRYGDCKDKAALLVAMLRTAGVSAWPALVSTSRGTSLDDWAPSPLAFDHAIVHVQLSSGDTLWIDPTLTLQGGGLDRMRYSPFDRALELEPTTTQLARTTREPADEALFYVRDEFHVAFPGTGKETGLDSTRVYRGSSADAMRRLVRSRTKEQMRKDFAQIYQTDYPTIHDAGDLEVSDDRDRDELQVFAHFAIPSFWTLPADASKPYRADIPARVLDRALLRPSPSVRTIPFAVSFPMHTRYEAIALLPFDMAVSPQSVVADALALHFRFSSTYESRRIAYKYEVSTTASEVDPRDLKTYVAAVDTARAALSRSLTYLPSTPDGLNWPILALFSAALPLCLWGAYRTYCYNPEPGILREPDPRLVGIGGWLLLIAIQVVFSPLSIAAETLNVIRIVASRTKWAAFTTPQLSSYSPASAGFLVVEALLMVALTAYGVALIRIFFARRRSFPKHYSVFMLAFAAITVFDVTTMRALAPNLTNPNHVVHAIARIGWTIVWVAYMRVSRRVASTFVT